MIGQSWLKATFGLTNTNIVTVRARNLVNNTTLIFCGVRIYREGQNVANGNTELNNTQTAVLEKGFNFAITPKSIPELDIVTGVETGLRKIRNAAAVTIARSKVAEILKTANPPPNRNVTREEEALKEWKNNEKIVILKADKGNATVVMNTEDYEEKVNSLLSDECTYKKLPTRPNPVNQITSRINQYVWNLYRNEKINKKCYYYLRCSNAMTPRFYGPP